MDEIVLNLRNTNFIHGKPNRSGIILKWMVNSLPKIGTAPQMGMCFQCQGQAHDIVP
jgi:hypothetical protein